MNILSQDVTNTCQYTPVYLIQESGVIEANGYVLTPGTIEEHIPVTNNLKTFYESSGNIDNDLLKVGVPPKTSILKKRERIHVGNNLNVESLPKRNSVNKQYIFNSIVLKPSTTTSNSVPKIDIDSKIVTIKDAPPINRKGTEKLMPKIKPKEIATSQNQPKYTTVQLIKLGENYHSLNKLSDEKMKMVTQALEMFKDPSNNTFEPTYDPVTNTKYIYKVVSPRDLAVVDKRKLNNKDKQVFIEFDKKLEENTKSKKKDEKVAKQVIPKEPEEMDVPQFVMQNKVTRSGRRVKLPKQILPEGSPQKSKKKSDTIVSCFQCSADFGTLYRLQKHYEHHPTHIPAKIHSNLFHCLLAIIKSGSEADKTNIFIQQLEQLVVKLKSLLPCIMKRADSTEGQACTINDDVGRLFGMNAGKYKFDVDALDCVKDQNGYCIHNPPIVEQANKGLQNQQHKNLCEDIVIPESETENCARINSVAKWPTVSKRIWKLKQRPQESNAKKIRLQSEGISINVLDDDFTIGIDDTNVIVSQSNTSNEIHNNEHCNINCQSINSDEHINKIEEQSKSFKNNHVQFQSAHFDIRSSPIKSSSTVFSKFQIDPSKLGTNYEAQAICPLGIVEKEPVPDAPLATTTSTVSDPQDIFKVDKSNSIDNELKEWIITNEKSEDSLTKSLIKPALMHVRDEVKSHEENLTQNNVVLAITSDNLQTESLLQFLEGLGNEVSFPDTEIRNSSTDYQMDFFTFNNT